MSNSIGKLATAVLVLAVLGRTAAVGDMLADYRFGTSYTLDLSSSNTNPWSTANDFARGSGIVWGSSSAGNPKHSLIMYEGGLTSETESEAIIANEYVTFSITPEPNVSFNLTGLTFDVARERIDSPRAYSLRADEDPGGGGDNYGTLIAAGTFPDTPLGTGTFVNYSINLSGTPFLQGITQETTLRIYLYDVNIGGGYSSGRLRFDNVVLTGFIPEPSALVLLTIGGLGLLVARRRRKR